MELFLHRLACDIKCLSRFVGFVQVDVGRHEMVLHHQQAINYLACAGHPALVSGHGFSGTDEGFLACKELSQSLRFCFVA